MQSRLVGYVFLLALALAPFLSKLQQSLVLLIDGFQGYSDSDPFAHWRHRIVWQPCEGESAVVLPKGKGIIYKSRRLG